MMICNILSADPRYTLHAYVCGEGCVNWWPGIGAVSFNNIYVNRPDNCRFAVATGYTPLTQGDPVIVWDLYKVEQNSRGQIIVPKPVRTHPDVYSAVMATTMLYDEDDD